MKIEYQFIYLGSNISSTESDVCVHIGDALTAIYRLPTIRKSNLSDKIRQEFFQAVAVLVLLCGGTTKNFYETP